MKKNLIPIFIILALTIALGVSVYTYTWFTTSGDYNLEGTAFSGMNKAIITIGDDVFSTSPMGDYKGQTGLDFYDYVLDDDLAQFTYIYDAENNNVTRNFAAYDVTVKPYIFFESEGKAIKIINTSHPTQGLTRTEIDIATGVINVYKLPDEQLFASTQDGDNITVTDYNTKVIKNFITYNFTRDSVSEYIYHYGGYYTVIDIDSTPNTYTIYDSFYEMLYDSSTIEGQIVLDVGGIFPNVLVFLDEDENHYLGVYKTPGQAQDILEIIYNTDGTVLHKISRQMQEFYILRDSNNMILYNEETDYVQITVTDTQITAYAVEGSDYEDAAYLTTKSFDLLVTIGVDEVRDLNVVPIFIGIVPEYTTELATRDDVTSGTIYYTGITTQEETFKLFGLTAEISLVDTVNTIKVNNYDNELYTVTTMTYHEYDEALYGSIYYKTTLGYTVYYAAEGYPLATAAQIAGNPDNLRVNIRNNYISYVAATHGAIQYSTTTADGYLLYFREYDIAEGINDFSYATQAQIDAGLDLYIVTSDIKVYDSNDTLLYQENAETTIYFEVDTIYYLPTDTFLDDFYWEIWIAEEIDDVLMEYVKYHPDENGSFVDEDNVKLGVADTTIYNCILKLYFSDGFTYRNIHSEQELTYQYNISKNKYEVTESGELSAFRYSDNSYIGSHFILKLTIGSNVY